jgi:hypothetical protein
MESISLIDRIVSLTCLQQQLVIRSPLHSLMAFCGMPSAPSKVSNIGQTWGAPDVTISVLFVPLHLLCGSI